MDDQEIVAGRAIGRDAEREVRRVLAGASPGAGDHLAIARIIIRRIARVSWIARIVGRGRCVRASGEGDQGEGDTHAAERAHSARIAQIDKFDGYDRIYVCRSSSATSPTS